MKRHTCIYHSGTESSIGCSAPLCPMDEQSIKAGVWFPDEEVCRRSSVPRWVKKQRRIVLKNGDKTLCWSVRMLEKISRICDGAAGMNPDRNPGDAESSWLNSVAGMTTVRTYTDEQRQAMREAFLSRIQKNKNPSCAE
jgi:hypothetical protein